MSVKSIINSILNFFKKVFHSITPELQTAVKIGVQVTNAIKNFDTNNPEVLDILTAIIPGNFDDLLKEKLRTQLPVILKELQLVQSVTESMTPEEITAAAIKTIQQLSGDYRSAFLNSLSIIVAQVAADGKLSWNDAVYLLKWYYDHAATIEQENSDEAKALASAKTAYDEANRSDIDAEHNKEFLMKWYADNK